MIAREWNIETPTPHVIQLEYRFLQSDVVLRVDGAPYASWWMWSTSAPVEPVVIDGVSYSLMRLPALGGRYELLPTELVRRLPVARKFRLKVLIWSVAVPTVGVLLLVTAWNIQPLIRAMGIPRRDVAMMTVMFVSLFPVAFAVFAWIGYEFGKPMREMRDGDHVPSRSNAAREPLPRDGEYFRPLLTDITATAARWKREIMDIRIGRH